MRTASAFFMLALVLVVVGAGLSYSGYNESLQTLTVTSTQQTTVISTATNPVTTVTSTFTTSRTEVVLSDTIDLGAPGKKYCGLWDSRYASVDAGQVHVSFNSIGGPVDFWVLTQVQWEKWNSTSGCDPLLKVPAVASRFGSVSYDFTTNIASSGMYYFVFMNRNDESVYIDLKVDSSHQEVVLTERTSYSTQSVPRVTETVVVSSNPAGFGLLFFSGMALIIIGGIVLLVGRSRYRPQQAASSFQAAAPTSQVPSAVASVSSPTTAKKFCMNCGAPLSFHAAFCNKCGSKQ